MARCRVSYADAEGSHSVEVTADTLYEAIAMAVVEFKGRDDLKPAAAGDGIHDDCDAQARRAYNPAETGPGIGGAIYRWRPWGGIEAGAGAEPARYCFLSPSSRIKNCI
jgi:hypothetical protein